MAYSQESLLCVLWIIIVSVMNENQATTMTGKIAQKVELCPRTTKDWLRASKRLNCTNDFSNPVNRYHCLPADDLSTLVEFCYKETRPRVSKGSCMLYVQNISYLNGYNCSGFSEGCPNNMYFSDESYQFPRCVEINSKRRCFVAESSCRETTKTNQTTHSTSTETSKRNDDVLAWSIFSAVFLLVVIVIVVICICISKRGVCHERITKKRDTALTQKPDDSNETDSFLSSAIMPPKKRARRDDVATGGVPPPTPTEVQMEKKGPKRTQEQSETGTINVLPNIDYELLAKKNVNQQKAAGEKPNISESVGQPPMVNSVEDTAPVVGEAIPAAATIPASAAATIPASALGTLLDNVFTEWRLRESPEKCSDISISDVDDVTHISFVTPEFIWLDNKQWAMKIDHKGNILSKFVVGDIWGSASSTVDEYGNLLFINQHNKVMKVKANEEEPTEMLTVDHHLTILSVYYAKLRREILLRIYLHDGIKIVRYNNNGEKISEFEYYKHDKSMVYPLFLSENTNRDICIADNFDGRVRAFSEEEDGNLRQRYSYEGRPPHYNFSPTGICNDSRGHVLVCNCHKSNPSVHLLDINGRFLSMIIDGKMDVTDPWGLCANKGKLYLSQKDCNVIKVFSYMYLEKINH